MTNFDLLNQADQEPRKVQHGEVEFEIRDHPGLRIQPLEQPKSHDIVNDEQHIET